LKVRLIADCADRLGSGGAEAMGDFLAQGLILCA
jgi:hypothetical protein